jgi:excisionase family DNA binding protein
MPDYYSTRELAALLKVKERKIYDLAAAGAIPVFRVTGKLLFPREAIQNWLQNADPHVLPASGNSEIAVAAGAQDPLLQWALRESRCGIAGFFEGAADGLRRAETDSCIMTGLNLPDSDGWNIEIVSERFSHKPWVLIEWARRRRGLIARLSLGPTPTRLNETRGLNFLMRPSDGDRNTLDRLLGAERMSRADLKLVETGERSETGLALALAEGRADIGFGLEAAAREFGLGFAPLVEDRFDLLVERKAFFDPPVQKLMAFCHTERFREKASALGGYDLQGFGAVHFNGA